MSRYHALPEGFDAGRWVVEELGITAELMRAEFAAARGDREDEARHRAEAERFRAALAGESPSREPGTENGGVR